MEDKLIDILKNMVNEKPWIKLNSLGMTNNEGNVDRTYDKISTKQGEDDDERNI